MVNLLQMTGVLVISILHCALYGYIVSVCWWITRLLVAGQLKKQGIGNTPEQEVGTGMCKSCISRSDLKLMVFFNCSLIEPGTTREGLMVV